MHTKRISAGVSKKPRWFTTPNAGSPKKENSKTLIHILRDILKHADNFREASRIVTSGLVQVNKKVVREPKYSVGLMDVIELPKIKAQYRMLPSSKGLKLKEITPQEASIKPCRIVDKQTLPGKKTQLNLHDGTTILLEKNTFKTKDTLILELPSRKIKEALDYKKGAFGLIYQGRHRGDSGVITEISEGTASKKSVTKINDIETLTEYVFVIGKEKPLISI